MKINNRMGLAGVKTAGTGRNLSLIGAMALLTLSGQAYAEGEAPSITVYGNLDSGIEYLTNIGAGGDAAFRVPGITGTMASRLGFKANKDIGDGYTAFAVMEMGVNADDGTHGQAGRVFGRQLNFGMQTPSGRWTLGRQYSPLIFALGDLMGPNIYALGSLDAYLPNARYDNAVSWSNKLGESLSAAVAYSFGRDTTGGAPASGTCSGETAGDSSACTALAAMLKYTGDGFGLAAAFDQMHGGTGATAFFFNGSPPVSMADSGDTDTRVALSGYYNLGDSKVSLGLLNRDVDTAANKIKSQAIHVSAQHKLSPKTTINGAIYSITNDDQDADATMLVLRGIYNIDKGIDTYLQLSTIDNSSNAAYGISPGAGLAPAAGESQSGIMLGFRFKY